MFLIDHVSRLLSQFGYRWMPLFDPRAESPFTCVTRLVEFVVALSEEWNLTWFFGVSVTLGWTFLAWQFFLARIQPSVERFRPYSSPYGA